MGYQNLSVLERESRTDEHKNYIRTIVLKSSFAREDTLLICTRALIPCKHTEEEREHPLHSYYDFKFVRAEIDGSIYKYTVTEPYCD